MISQTHNINLQSITTLMVDGLLSSGLFQLHYCGIAIWIMINMLNTSKTNSCLHWKMQHGTFPYDSPCPLVTDLDNDRVLIAFRIVSMINRDFILVVTSKAENAYNAVI